MDAGDSEGGGLYELVGEGGYAGLSMYLVPRPGEGLFGIIIPTVEVPEQPEPPAE